MVRKQNERTIRLQYRIIPLSLPTNSILSYFSTPCPLSTRLGAFLSPETFSRKFFPKFFLILPRRLFAVFLVRKIMGVEGACRSANRGGVSLFVCSLYIKQAFIHSSTSRVQLPSIVSNFHPNTAKQGKSKHLFSALLSYPRNFGDNKRQKPNIFLKCGCMVGGSCWLCLPAFWRVHRCRRAGFRACVLLSWRVLSSGRVFPAFCPLVCFVLGALA